MSDSIQYDIQDLGSHVYFRVSGDYDLDSFLTLISDILKIGLASESKKVICDTRGTENLLMSDTDRFRIGEAIANSIGLNIRLAGVSPPETINHFAELVASNRGASFKMFSSVDAARQWLLEEDVLADVTKRANRAFNRS